MKMTSVAGDSFRRKAPGGSCVRWSFQPIASVTQYVARLPPAGTNKQKDGSAADGCRCHHRPTATIVFVVADAHKDGRRVEIRCHGNEK